MLNNGLLTHQFSYTTDSVLSGQICWSRECPLKTESTVELFMKLIRSLTMNLTLQYKACGITPYIVLCSPAKPMRLWVCLHYSHNTLLFMATGRSN